MPDVTNIVRIPTFQRFTGSNAAQVVVTASRTVVFTIDVGELETDDIILVNAGIPGIKGLTAGDTFFQFDTVGFALQWGASPARWQFPNLPANSNWRPLLMAEAVSGFNTSFEITVEGESQGSDFTIGAGNARGSAVVIRPIV